MAAPTPREVEAIVKSVWKIPGLYRKDETRFLYRLARRYGNLVELGCWMGRTTAILVQAAAVWGAHVTTVDSFAPMPNNRKAASRILWETNLKKLALIPPDLLEMTSDGAAKIYDKEISLLFIDANHTKASVARDLRNWTPKIKVDGVVALHDMFYPSVTGVCQAVTDWWSRERIGVTAPAWELVGLQDFTIAFRRVK